LHVSAAPCQRLRIFVPATYDFVSFGTAIASARQATLDIRFVSTLTADDEERIAGVLLNALVKLLKDLPIAYALRIETTGAKVFQQSNMSDSDAAAEPEHATSVPATRDRKPPG
jgi:hypothetical protein